MNDAKAVEERLRTIMHSWLMPIEPGCEKHLAHLIHQAAQRVEAEGFAANPGKLWEAENNFRRLLTEMTWEAGVLGLHELHESTLLNSLRRLCPIFPFC